tara:strand:+ start:1336 stop:1944 length:609 start_codon:yes stop_codon:yes gene_type:complete
MKLLHTLSLLLEETKPSFLDFQKGSGNYAGQELFDYVRKWEGDVYGNHIPYVYDDKRKWEKGKPVKYTGGTKYGTLTIGFGTTDPTIIKEYLNTGKEMTLSTAQSLTIPDINEAARCIKSWQSRAKKGDKNNRLLTIGMYRAMIDIVYNIGCNAFIHSPTLIVDIEKGNYKKASATIRKGNWGHKERRESTANLFCSSGGCI